MKKSFPIAAAGVAVLALAGGGLVGPSVASADDGGKSAAPHLSAKRAQVSSCTGGKALAMSSRTMDYQSVAAGATADVEGSLWNVKGPKKGTDTVLVTLSSLALNGASQLAYVSLYKDGVGTPEGQKYYGYGSTPATVQFCVKIAKGQHQLELRVQDDGGSGLTMYNPTVTYQRFS